MNSNLTDLSISFCKMTQETLSLLSKRIEELASLAVFSFSPVVTDRIYEYSTILKSVKEHASLFKLEFNYPIFTPVAEGLDSCLLDLISGSSLATLNLGRVPVPFRFIDEVLSTLQDNKLLLGLKLTDLKFTDKNVQQKFKKESWPVLRDFLCKNKTLKEFRLTTDQSYNFVTDIPKINSYLDSNSSLVAFEFLDEDYDREFEVVSDDGDGTQDRTSRREVRSRTNHLPNYITRNSNTATKLKDECQTALTYGRFLAGSRPKDGGYRLPYELMQQVFCRLPMTESTIGKETRSVIRKAILDKRTSGMLKSDRLLFGAHELAFICRRILSKGSSSS